SLEIGVHRLYLKESDKLDQETLESRLAKPDDERLFLIAEAYRRGYTLEQLQELTSIDWWFLRKLQNMVQFESRLAAEALTSELLYEAKRMGFTDRSIAEIRALAGAADYQTEDEVRSYRLSLNLRPVYKMVDTCAAEFEASTPYYYSTYEEENEVVPSDKGKILVL